MEDYFENLDIPDRSQLNIKLGKDQTRLIHDFSLQYEILTGEKAILYYK